MDEEIRKKVIAHLKEKPNRLGFEIVASIATVPWRLLYSTLREMVTTGELIEDDYHRLSLPSKPKAKKK